MQSNQNYALDDSRTVATAFSSTADLSVAPSFRSIRPEAAFLNYRRQQNRPIQLPRQMPPEQAIQLVDARCESLTITWPGIQGAKHYIVEYIATFNVYDEFRVVSKTNDLHATVKGLSPNQKYWFRVTPALSILHVMTKPTVIKQGRAFRTLTRMEDFHSMKAPTAMLDADNYIVIKWKAQAPVDVEYRKHIGGAKWKRRESGVNQDQIRFNCLKRGLAYQFRLRPENRHAGVSPPSKLLVVPETVQIQLIN